jgi:hypothetical protein
LFVLPKTATTGFDKTTSFWAVGGSEETDIRQHPVHLYEQVFDRLGLSSYYDSALATEQLDQEDSRFDKKEREEENKNRAQICEEECKLEINTEEDRKFEEEEEEGGGYHIHQDDLFSPSSKYQKLNTSVVSAELDRKHQQSRQLVVRKSKLQYTFFLYWIGPEFGQRWEHELRRLAYILGRELAFILIFALALETCASIGLAITFLLEMSTLTDSRDNFAAICSVYTGFVAFILVHLTLAYAFYLFTNRKGYDNTSLDNFYKVNSMHAKMLCFSVLALIIMWVQYGTEAGMHPLDSYAENSVNRHGGVRGSLKTLPAEHMPSYPCFMFVYLIAQLLILKAVFQNHRGYIEQNGLTFAILADAERDRVMKLSTNNPT